jgi:hypothetical protein
MKKLYVMCLTVFLFFSTCSVYAEDETQSKLCRQQIEKRNKEYEQKILRDVLQTFDLEADIENRDTVLIGQEDFVKASLLFGRINGLYDSLSRLYHTGSAYRGIKVLLFADGNPEQAYLLYKQPDHTNVMMILKRMEKQWVVLEKRTQKGKHIPYLLVPCEEARSK